MVKNILRFLVFLIALMAVGVIVIGSGWYVLNQGLSSGGTEVSRPSEGGEAPSIKDIFIGLYLQYRQGDLDRPASYDDTPVTLVVEPGESAATIAARLEELGLVTDGELFRMFIRYHEIDATLEAGEYVLRPNMTMAEIAETLQHARIEEVTVTIPEGWRAEQIAQMLAEANIVDGDEFLALVRGGKFDYILLQDRPEESSLEGFLFPETYRIPAQAEAEDLIERMLSTLEERFTPEMRQLAAERGMTIYDVITLASIVEREAVMAEERPLIANVFLNRLEEGMFLRADPTVQYAKGYDATTGQWWPAVTPEDWEAVDSPYSTYLYPGLPPGPICSPGLSAIQAVLEPADTEYLFFLAKGDGSHAFATTYEEHLQNQELYQR
ncbi:MAG: endolytic transglycosylase MltG [Anaerolineales bacterium]|nr:MAG: endolytic transglycosylase MltG [Anaerolineales bacterium]